MSSTNLTANNLLDNGSDLYAPEKLNDSIVENKNIYNNLVFREESDIHFDYRFSNEQSFDHIFDNKSKYVPGEIIVKFKKGIKLNAINNDDKTKKFGVPSIDKLNEKNNVISINKISNKTTYDNEFLSDVFKIVILKETDIMSIIDEYSNNPNIEYAEPNYLFNNCTMPNDPLFDDQWALHLINAPNAWEIETGSSNVVVAVIDTGVDYTHPDLTDNIWYNYDEIPDNEIDDDGNGYVDDIMGWDFYNDDNNPIDDNGHGTHCSGIVAAVTNNSVGISGVSWESTIMPVKGLSRRGSGSTEDLTNCIYYAADNGADIISMSWGSTLPSNLIQDAVEYAYSKGVILVAAAGNSNSFSGHYPSDFDKVISVSATDDNDIKADFSNYGYKVDVAAPGVNILSTYPDEEYRFGSGTSMACPHVSGFAGLILSKNFSCPYKQSMVKTMIKNSVDEIISDKYIGTGRINLSWALENDFAVAILDSFSEETDITGTIEIKGITWSESFKEYILEYGRGKDPEIWTKISNSSEMKEGILGSLNTNNLEDGLYTIKLTLCCNNVTFFDKIKIVVNNEINHFTVDDNNSGDFQFIQDAIDNSGKGDSIYVFSGTYYESIYIKRPVDVIGENAETTKIFGKIEIFSNNISISGFKINSYMNPGIFLVYCNNVNISNNHIIAFDYGLVIGFSYENNFYNNIIEKTWCSFYLYNSENNFIFKNNINNTSYGLALFYSNNNTILNMRYKNLSSVDVKLFFSRGNILRNNFMIKGLELDGDQIIDFKNNVDSSNRLQGKPIYYIVDKKNILIPSDPGQIILINCSDSNISNLNIDNCSYGIIIRYSKNITIFNNDIGSCFVGIYIKYCYERIYISDNNFKNNYVCVSLIQNSNSHIIGNNMENNSYGCWIGESMKNDFIKNYFYNNSNAIYSIFGKNNRFQENNFHECYKYAFMFRKSPRNILRDNNMLDCGIIIESGDMRFHNITINDFFNDIDCSNTVNKKPVYYFINESNVNVPSDAGQLIFINCTKVNVSNFQFGKNIYGIELAFSHNNNILNCNLGGILLINSSNNLINFNTINGSNLGIELIKSNYNTILNNSVCNGTGSKWHNYRGIDIYFSNYNEILNNYLFNNTGFRQIIYESENTSIINIIFGLNIILELESNFNTIENNQIIGGIFAEQHSDIGVFLNDKCENNYIQNNLIKDNYYGVNFFIRICNNNTLYHNTFINNLRANADDRGINNWYNHTFKEGNIWDDYNGIDANGDGIGDTPYDIPGGDNQDLYPLGIFKDIEPPKVKIKKPENAIYFDNKKIIPFFKTIIIGNIEVEVNASDIESDIDKVEFYIDDILIINDTEEPYVMIWDNKTPLHFRHDIMVKAYDNEGNIATDEISVLKFF